MDDDDEKEMTREEFIQAAISHGIPREVAEGKKKLRDFFSKEYIDSQCNRDSDVDKSETTNG